MERGGEGAMGRKRDGEKVRSKELEEMESAHIIKDPYVLEFLDLRSNTNFYESELEQALIDKLRDFLLELGNGFSFVHRQYRISTKTKYFYVDLVLYNYILNFIRPDRISPCKIVLKLSLREI